MTYTHNLHQSLKYLHSHFLTDSLAESFVQTYYGSLIIRKTDKVFCITDNVIRIKDDLLSIIRLHKILRNKRITHPVGDERVAKNIKYFHWKIPM